MAAALSRCIRPSPVFIYADNARLQAAIMHLLREVGGREVPPACIEQAGAARLNAVLPAGRSASSMCKIGVAGALAHVADARLTGALLPAADA